jgi:hypothetical protein
MYSFTIDFFRVILLCVNGRLTLLLVSRVKVVRLCDGMQKRGKLRREVKSDSFRIK